MPQALLASAHVTPQREEEHPSEKGISRALLQQSKSMFRSAKQLSPAVQSSSATQVIPQALLASTHDTPHRDAEQTPSDVVVGLMADGVAFVVGEEATESSWRQQSSEVLRSA